MSLGAKRKFNVLECDSHDHKSVSLEHGCRNTWLGFAGGLNAVLGDLLSEILGESAPSSKKLHLKQNTMEWSQTIVTDARDVCD